MNNKRRITDEDVKKIFANEDLMKFKVESPNKYNILRLSNENEKSVAVFHRDANEKPTKVIFQGSNPEYFKTKINNFLDEKVKTLNAFVVMRFLPKYEEWFNKLEIHLKEHHIVAKKLNTDKRTSLLDHKLYEKLDKCDLAIINISEINENVAYEFGYLAKRFFNKSEWRFDNIILVIDKNEDISRVPFDLKNIERIEYNSESDSTFFSDIDKWIDINLKNRK